MIKIKNKQKKKLEILEGSNQLDETIIPTYINLNNPQYIEIDQTYYSTILIVNYYQEQNDLLLKNLIENNIDMNISMFYEKKDSYKMIRELTYYIGNTGVDLENKNQNNQDIDLVAFTHNDAKYIRKQMQLNNEELYFLYLYITVYSKEKRELEYLINKVEGILQSKGMQTRRAYFRQEQAFLSSLPIMRNHQDIKQVTKRNILTNGLVCTYPFISSSIFDEKGIYVGNNIYNHSLVFIDRYNTSKYKNSNMSIFGTSGAGKSFYTKLIILRNCLLGIEQYIIDPEREYYYLCKNLGGTYIKLGPTSNTFINIFDIRKESIEEDEKGYLSTKITKLIGFFNLIFGEMDEEEKAIIEEKIIECYLQKGITFDDETLYKKEEDKITITKIFKENKDMPKLEDFYSILEKDPKTKLFKTKLIPFVKGSLKYFNEYTNIKVDNSLIVADVYELGEENLQYGMYLFIDLFWDKIKINRKNKKSIYLDEIWRLIGITSNQNVASFIYKIFKTIRKYGGSAVAITQDISDLFSLENGIYGRSILNNSSIKTFFSLEEENIKILSEYSNLSEKEKVEIKSLKRGECLMIVGENHILIKIEANEFEKKIINEMVGEDNEEDINSSTK